MYYGYSPYSDYFGDGAYNYYGSGGISQNFMSLFVTIMASVLLFVGALCLVFYIFQAIGIYTLAKKRGMSNAFLAFIPVANAYYLGRVADDIGRTMNKKTNHAKRILIPLVIGLAISIFGSLFASMLAAIITVTSGGSAGIPIVLLTVVVTVLAVCALTVAQVFEYIAMYAIFKEYSPANAVLFIVLSILLDIAPFLFFAIRNRPSGYELWSREQAAQAARERACAQEPAQVFSATDSSDNTDI